METSKHWSPPGTFRFVHHHIHDFPKHLIIPSALQPYKISNTFASHVKSRYIGMCSLSSIIKCLYFLQLTAAKQQKVDADSQQRLPRLAHVVFDKFFRALFAVNGRCWGRCVGIVVAPSLIQRRSFCFMRLRFRWNSHNNWFPVLVRHLKREGEKERSFIFRTLFGLIRQTSDVGSGEKEKSNGTRLLKLDAKEVLF